MRYSKKSRWMPAQEGYDVAFTRLNDGFFHQRVAPGSPGYAQDAAASQPGASDEYPWLSRGSSITLSANINPLLPVLLADNYRNLLIIQNTSSATAPDVAPTLYVNVDGPVLLPGSAGHNVALTYSLAFPPGFGIIMDERILTNALYVAYGGAINTGFTVVTGGVLTYGRTPNSPPLQPLSTNPTAAMHYRYDPSSGRMIASGFVDSGARPVAG